MKQQVKNEWIINNQNIFGLQQDIRLSISFIQYEILNQVEGKNIKSISDYLGVEIDISKEIRLTKKFTIRKVFEEFLGFENIFPLEQNNFNCSLILDCLQLSLFEEYSKNKHKNILTFSEYKTQYNSLLNNFLTSNIDTDEQDFIKAELTLCNNLLTEMNKPAYSVLSIFNEVLDKPCEYKKNLINSIDKRKKFLEKKANNQMQSEALPPQPIAKQKTEKLEQLFEYTSKYKTVMEIFVDKQFIHAQTYIWKDEKANYKSLMCALVKDLEGKGYYKQEIKMNYELCKTICKNTFHVTIGSNKTYYNSALPPTIIGLIPFASTLE